MMLEENPGPGAGVVHRRHRQRSGNGASSGIPTHHAPPSSPDDVSISSDDSKKLRHNRKGWLARLLTSKGMVAVLVVLIVGSSIAALLFWDGSAIVADHVGGGGGYGSSLRGRGVQLAKEVGNRWEKHRRNVREARSARESPGKKQRVKNDDRSSPEAAGMGALDYAGKQPTGTETASRGSRSNRGQTSAATNTEVSGNDDLDEVTQNEQDPGGNTADEDAASQDNATAAASGDSTKEGEEGEEREESDHFWITDYTYVDVYNTSLPENKYLASDLSMENPSKVARNMVARISSSVSFFSSSLFVSFVCKSPGYVVVVGGGGAKLFSFELLSLLAYV